MTNTVHSNGLAGQIVQTKLDILEKKTKSAFQREKTFPQGCHDLGFLKGMKTLLYPALTSDYQIALARWAKGDGAAAQPEDDSAAARPTDDNDTGPDGASSADAGRRRFAVHRLGGRLPEPIKPLPWGTFALILCGIWWYWLARKHAS